MLVISNKRLPLTNGYYETINSKGTTQITLFKDKHWQITLDQYPVVKWIDVHLN